MKRPLTCGIMAYQGCTNCLAADMDTLRFLFVLGCLYHVTVWRQTTEFGFAALVMVGNAYNNIFNEIFLRRISST